MKSPELDEFIEVPFSGVIPLFERLLFQLVRVDVTLIRTKLKEIWGYVTRLRLIAEKYQGKIAGKKVKLFNVHLEEAVKLCGDQEPLLPDSLYLSEFMKNFRSKLRSLHHASTSTKSVNAKEMASIYSEALPVINVLLLSVAQLEQESKKQVLLLEYIKSLKSRVCKPVAELLNDVAQLDHSESPIQMNVRLQDLHHCESEYESARSHEVLAEVARTKKEAGLISKYLIDMFAPLRSCVAKLSKTKAAQLFNGINAIHSLDRILSLEGNDLLACLCINDAKATELASSVKELRSEVYVEFMTAEQEKVVREFDAELLFAYLADWQLRAEELSKVAADTGFTEALKKLKKARHELGRAISAYEVETLNQDAHLFKTSHLQTTGIALKEVVEEIFRTELRTHIRINIDGLGIED